MANNYQFLDAYGSVKTAATIEVSSAHQPIVNIAGSVITVGGGTTNQSVSGTVNIGNAPSISGGVINIVGSVAAVQSGAWTTSIVGGVSILGGTVSFTPGSISGVGIFNTNHAGNGSIITVFSSPSIVGTYSEDATHTSADKGVFTLGVRNDATSSFVSADLEYTPKAVDSAGRTITKPFAADQSSIFGTGSVNGAASVAVIASPGVGLRNYITDVMIANTGAAGTLVRFTAGGASVLGYTIAPAGGGSNMIGFATPIATHANSPFNIAADTATSVLYATAYGYRAP